MAQPAQFCTDQCDAFPVLRVSSAETFQSLSSLESDAVLWQRALPDAVQDWLDALPIDELPTGRYLLQPSEVAACLEQCFEAQGLSAHPAQSWLCNDAQRLADIVANLHGASTLRLRLEAVHDNACRKFHIDHVVARLICTYRGPGTQLSATGQEADAIETIGTGAPILLKGKLWPQSTGIELQHRSPPIEETGLSRLVLVLEPVRNDDEFGTSCDQRFIAN